LLASYLLRSSCEVYFIQITTECYKKRSTVGTHRNSDYSKTCPPNITNMMSIKISSIFMVLGSNMNTFWFEERHKKSNKRNSDTITDMSMAWHQVTQKISYRFDFLYLL
jgi:hypothetical protein